ncbi:MAG: TetR/AcrR family transcriptional regulator [Nevskiaceae bacterium]
MAYRRTRRVKQRLAENRERIVLGARALITRGGLRQAQMAEVAKGAGMSTGAIYKYFPSQTELFIEVLRDAVRHEIDILQQIAKAPGSNAQRLRLAVESFVRRALEGPHLAYAFIAEPADARVEAARLRARRALTEVYQGIVREGIARGEFPEQDLDVTAACIFGAFTEALVGPIAARGVRDKEKLVRAIVTFCERAVAGRGVIPAPA